MLASYIIVYNTDQPVSPIIILVYFYKSPVCYCKLNIVLVGTCSFLLFVGNIVTIITSSSSGRQETMFILWMFSKNRRQRRYTRDKLSICSNSLVYYYIGLLFLSAEYLLVVYSMKIYFTEHLLRFLSLPSEAFSLRLMSKFKASKQKGFNLFEPHTGLICNPEIPRSGHICRRES